MKSVSITMIVLFVLGCGFLWYLFEYRPQQRIERAIKHANCMERENTFGSSHSKAKRTCDLIYK